MAVKLKKLMCTQCGGNDITKIDVNQYKCASCGSLFVIEKSNKITKEVRVHIEDNKLIKNTGEPCKAFEISNNVSEEEFIRQAWISLVKEDAPFSAFETDFFDFIEKEHRIIENNLTARVSYSASVGYKREESYIDYEDYQEKVGDNWVTKKRPVTKYRVVTDWSPFSTQGCFETTAIAEIDPGTEMDSDEFKKCCDSSTTSKLLPVSDERYNMIYDIKDGTRDLLAYHHDHNLLYEILDALPGDCSNDEKYLIDEIYSETNKLYFASEYQAKIKVNDKIYIKKMFPFGEASVFGDEIENNESEQQMLETKLSKIPQLVWNESKNIFIISLVLLALSILVSLIFSYTPMVTIMFIIAIVFVGISELIVREKTRKIKEKTKKECKDFSLYYKTKQQELLNKKLSSLGLKCVEEDELYNLRNKEV